MSVSLRLFMEHSGVLPTTQFAYRKGLGACDALLCMSQAMQSALENRRRLGLYRLFAAQHLIVIHQRIFNQLCSVGIGGSVLSILTVPIKLITASNGGLLSEETQ